MTELGKEYFGPLWKYVADEKITDVDYNGREIWLTNTENMRYRANPEYIKEFITDNFIEQFTQRIANVVSRQFNKQNPQLEAETSELRVTIVHESVARSGRTISIRKTPPIIRLTEEKAVQDLFDLATYRFIGKQTATCIPVLESKFPGMYTETELYRIPSLDMGSFMVTAGDQNLEVKFFITETEDHLFAGGR